MNPMGISTDPALLDVELPHTLIESPSVSTFLPDEEASICPLLSATNGTTTPMTFSHPLTPGADDNDSNTSTNLCEDAKVETSETSSSSGSSSGIGMDVPDTAGTTLFNKLAYQHLQNNNNGLIQDTNGHGPNGSLTLSKDTPSFVSWNWPLIRKCTFFIFMSSLLAMCAVVVSMILMLPKTCNPKTAWYRGSVFYEIFPASYQDSNNDGVGDIRGIVNRIDYLSAMGVGVVRLNSIFPSPHYPEDYRNITSLRQVASVLGELGDIRQLVESLHAQNISLVLDFPINSYVKELGKVIAPLEKYAFNSSNAALDLTTIRSPISENSVTEAIRMWTQLGIDGFYIKGLENFVGDDDLLANLAEWKRIIGSDRVLLVSELLIDGLPDKQKSVALAHVDLIDVYLDILNGTKHIAKRVGDILSGILAPTNSSSWIHWSIGGVEKQRLRQLVGSANVSLAATVMQLMLPGTASIFYGDEIALEGVYDPHNEHNDTKHLHHLPAMQWSTSAQQFTNRETLPWLPQTSTYNFENVDTISIMIHLRNRSPAIYKNAICKTMTTPLANTHIRRVGDDVLIVERNYPRKNSFVSLSNFEMKSKKMDISSNYYSGLDMLQTNQSEKIYFDKFEIGPLETIVVKLDK